MEAIFSNSPFIFIIGAFLFSLYTLSKSADFLTDSAISFSKLLGVSDIVIGATIVSLGTSLPEFATSITALISGSSDLALGNSLGSIITNLSFILGIGILYGSIPVSKHSTLNAWLTFFGIVAVYTIALINNQFTNHALLPRFIGILFLLILPIYLFLSFRSNSTKSKNKTTTLSKEKLNTNKIIQLILKIVLSGFIVALSSSVLVATIQISAKRLGMSEAIISATIVALGTSLPELSTVITSVRKGHGGLAFGNLIGASLMNLLLVLSTTITFSKNEILVPNSFLQFHFPLAILILLYLIYCIYNSKKHELTKKEGGFFLIVYGIYIIFNLLTNSN